MPGHFTHIYTARRVSEFLKSGQFPDWPAPAANALIGRDPRSLGQVMQDWEKFTAIGAIGPDLFYFCQDWNNDTLGPVSDELFLALATYYFIDAAKEADWEPLLTILAEANSQLAALIRFLIKLQKAWDDFVTGWNETVGPIVDDIENLIDGLTGGVLSQFGMILDELKLALKTIAEEELTTFKDIFSAFDTCLQKGYGEKLFLWSDMSHYRRPSALCQAFIRQVEIMEGQARDLRAKGFDLLADGVETQAEQFLAFSLGYMTHLGTDTVAHSFVNEQCGGPYRNHPQRHHVIENHIDAWNYDQTGPGGRLAPDPWGKTDDYQGVSMSALWFAVQLTPEDPKGQQRPTGPWKDDAARTKALDVDGEMPDWMANAIVAAMIDCYQDPEEHPQILLGSAFQAAIDEPLLTRIFNLISGGGLDRPFTELRDAIAPAPPFEVPRGFPLPWEMKTVYKIMYSYYRLVYNGTWELQKPKSPDFIIFPPASDIENLFQPPDLSGVNSSNPVADVCETIIALVESVVKTIEAVGKLIGDLIKMLNSPSTYLLRLGLYELAMMVWDIVTKVHEVMAHTGFFSPHAAAFYDDGELRLPDEIDMPLITLGGTVDGAFLAALADAYDPFGNLDKNEGVIGFGHSVRDPNYPYYPVLRYDTNGTAENWEYHRPWAWPDQSPVQQPNGPDTFRTTPTETYNPFRSFGEGPDESFKPLMPGPYPVGTQPDVFFRTNAPVDPQIRSLYEQAQTPWDTDVLNRSLLLGREMQVSPLGDPIPFSAHLISQLANDTGYSTQFNLDSDRAFAYLTWDWVRNDINAPGGKGTGILGLTYATPVEPPEGDPGGDPLNPHANPAWALGNRSLLLKYKDPPNAPKPQPIK